jgi:hypothetical protein
LCRASAKQLGLEPGIQIDAEVQELIVESAEAVIVSVYDAEAYVALVSSDVLDRRRGHSGSRPRSGCRPGPGGFFL